MKLGGSLRLQYFETSAQAFSQTEDMSVGWTRAGTQISDISLCSSPSLTKYYEVMVLFLLLFCWGVLFVFFFCFLKREFQIKQNQWVFIL